MRCWIHTIGQLSSFIKSDESFPHSSIVADIFADGPSLDRLLQIVGWNGIGAALSLNNQLSLRLKCSPPSTLALGTEGAFEVGFFWPTDGEWTLSKEGGKTELRGPNYLVNSANENVWRANIKLRNNALNATIPVFNPSLMNRDFQEFPLVRSEAFAADWSPDVMRAAEAIALYSHAAGELTKKLVSSVVPLVCADHAIGSASREEALGLVFLPATKIIDQLTECLLHETMHQYLFRIEECGDLFEETSDKEARYYSPWRTDPRPLRMALHGAFVFMAIADLYSWEGAPRTLNLSKDDCIRRAYHRCRQVRTALDIVRRNGEFTRFGQVVIQALEHDYQLMSVCLNPKSTDRKEMDLMLSDHSAKYANYSR
jgi:HEXXH motif-containing protein